MDPEHRAEFDGSLAKIGSAPSVVSDDAREERRRIAQRFLEEATE